MPSFTSREASLYSKSKIQEQLDKILSEQLSMMKQQQQPQQQQFNNKPNQSNQNNKFYYKTDPQRQTPATVGYQMPNSTPQMISSEDAGSNKSVGGGGVALANRKNMVPRIQHLLFNFDYIDLKKNQIEVLTSDTQAILYAQIVNRTDIFKGINGGAIYLHAKTSLYLNLDNYSNFLCLTGSNEANIDSLCSNGWTVSFWIKVNTSLKKYRLSNHIDLWNENFGNFFNSNKVSYLSLFDKTLLKIDNMFEPRVVDNSKFFTLRLSSFEIRVEFLYKRKFWSIQQSIVWKSEWTMITLTWQEFDGLSVYVNSVRLLCQQSFDYYSPNEPFSAFKPGVKNEKFKRSQNIFGSSANGFNSSAYGSTIFIGINNKLVILKVNKIKFLLLFLFC